MTLFSRSEIAGYDALVELALNIRFAWNHKIDEVWKRLDPELWELTRNPWDVLQTASREKLESLLQDSDYSRLVHDLVEAGRAHAESDAWFQRTYPTAPFSKVAYFSMEYMLSEALPIYSGGLGNVAGDQLKAASDLGVPIVCVGLLYQMGYFRQFIDRNGKQEALFPYNSPQQLPITPVREENGEWLRIKINFPGFAMWIRAWQVRVGRLKLYLLDSNDPENYPLHRGITSELYGGSPELRLCQELLLGIGGWRLLELIGEKPQVCHLNEGHAAFAVLERAATYMKETGYSFDVALTATRAGNLFTTHTAVSAGFDRFSPELMEKYLTKYARDSLGVSLYDVMALGRSNPNDTSEYFNMAYLAIRGSGAINAVSSLHGKVSRSIFASLFPRSPESAVPVGYVTNGVHMPSWDSKAADDIWTEFCGKDRWRGEIALLEEDMRQVPEERLWQMKNQTRFELVEYTRKRLVRQYAVSGESAEEIERARHILDPNALTLGFARRFATYKRPNMLLHDPERLLGILTNQNRPVQLIIAGKAHPADLPGQALIQEWMQFIKQTNAKTRVVFISDYDMLVSEQLVAGVDVWINTPRRPWEACGTSGMKVLVNGGINLSELDGWWAEAYTPEVGWAVGDGKEHDEDPVWDALDAEQLYTILESKIVPEFYTRDVAGIPVAWVQRMRESMATLTPRFSASRAVIEYTERYYIPLAQGFEKRTKDGGAKSKEIVDWLHAVEQAWPMVSFKDIKVESKEGVYQYAVQVHLEGLSPDSVKVEVYAESPPFCKELTLELQTYTGSIPATRAQSEYTVRMRPYFPDVLIPLEAPYILWQR